MNTVLKLSDLVIGYCITNAQGSCISFTRMAKASISTYIWVNIIFFLIPFIKYQEMLYIYDIAYKYSQFHENDFF